MQNYLRDQLQASLGDGYAIEHELGGGGMSHVFVARDNALKRQVVVKVLAPELAAGVSHERFRREIELAASLQHPHIVPLLHAGDAGGLLYYTMPIVTGESLRDRIAREGSLPILDTVRLLRDVVDALAYAHRRGVVHRDIKPGNVLLTENHAMVTDFGVAKALSDSAGASDGGALTSIGVALGTPAYMAPEQAAADPHTDHRADIYAVGVLAYELLAGVTPFTGASSQALLVAQLTDDPEPVTKYRPSTPPRLASLVMRCLEKNPADRWRSADELMKQLDIIAATLDDGGIADFAADGAGKQSGRRTHLGFPLIALLYFLTSAAVLASVKLATVQLGLPDWTFPGSVVLLLVGLPVVVVTAISHRRVSLRATRASRERPSGRLGSVTWRKTIFGFLLAFAFLGIVVAGYMAMQTLGIGPVRSLLAAGVLKERERILVADFANQTPDSLLGGVVTEAFRIDLAQSPVVTVLQANYLRDALARMQTPSNTPLNLTLAREIAIRDGIKAIIAGEISEAGARFVVSAQIVSAQTGEVLAAARETASDSSGIIGAIDDLSRTLRERIGESLRTIRANEPLDQVTTGSLEALRRYTQAIRAIEVEGDFSRGIDLLQEAVALDTTFAMAYRKLGQHLGNVGTRRTLAVDALTKAYRYRERLTERERYLLLGTYYWSVLGDRHRAIASYRTLLETYPRDHIALINIGNGYAQVRQFERSEEVSRRALEIDSMGRFGYSHLAFAEGSLGKMAEARATVDRGIARLPRNPDLRYFRASMLASSGDFAAAEAELRSLRERHGESQFWVQATNTALAQLASAQGRLAEAEQYVETAMAAAEAEGTGANYILGAVRLALADIALRQNSSRALQRLDRALARHPLGEMEPLDRPYRQVALVLALADKPERARTVLREREAVIAADLRRADLLRLAQEEHTTLGALAVAEKRYADAIAEFRSADIGPCRICALSHLGGAYELAGALDSTLEVQRRYLTLPALDRVFNPVPNVTAAGFGDGLFLTLIHKRLAELYEERGERASAVRHYARVVELWKDADMELQPVVTQARRQLAKLENSPVR